MLVAIHGFTETDCSWSEVFQGSGLTPITPLLPGHGGKPCPPDTTMSGVADAVVASLPPDQAVDLVGYSLGGRVAIQLALNHSNRVRRLILISCRPGLEGEDIRQQRRKKDEALAQILEEDGIGPFVAWWEANPALRPFKPFPRPLQQHIRSRRLNQDPLGLAGCLRTMGQGVVPSLWESLGRITVPCLLIAGGADQRYPEDMQAMAQRMPQAQLTVVNDCGHAVHREQAATLIQLIRGFLA